MTSSANRTAAGIALPRPLAGLAGLGGSSQPACFVRLSGPILTVAGSILTGGGSLLTGAGSILSGARRMPTGVGSILTGGGSLLTGAGSILTYARHTNAGRSIDPAERSPETIARFAEPKSSTNQPPRRPIPTQRAS